MMTASPTQWERVSIHTGTQALDGVLWLPDCAIGMVAVVSAVEGHRVRPPNDYVASILRKVRLGTLWLDLLGEEDVARHASSLDINELALRLHAACDWLRAEEATGDLPLGLYGVHHGAAAILEVAASRKDVSAIVLRSGCEHLSACQSLGRISAPTLLLVGGLDDGAVRVNRDAYAALRCKKQFELIPGATRSFEEPGGLEVAARLARNWFMSHGQVNGDADKLL